MDWHKRCHLWHFLGCMLFPHEYEEVLELCGMLSKLSVLLRMHFQLMDLWHADEQELSTKRKQVPRCPTCFGFVLTAPTCVRRCATSAPTVAAARSAKCRRAGSRGPL